MLKKIFYIIIPPVLFLTACKKDFLDVSDKNSIARQDYVVNLKTTKEFLNGIYVLLSQDFYSGHNQIYPELIADNVKPITTTFNVLTPHYNWAMVTLGNNNMNRMWKPGYQIASSCNFVLEKAEEFKGESFPLANELKGHAYALRALVHFIMVNTFAQSYNFQPEANHYGIPYLQTYDWEQPITRLSVAEVYNELISDLNNAQTLLPANSLIISVNKAKFMMNQEAVAALLARAYLFKEDFAKAKSFAVAVSNKFPLLTENDYPSKLFTPAETEAIFQLVPSYGDGVNGTFFTSYQGAYFYDGYKTQFLATADITSLLNNPNDRRKAWIKSGGIDRDTITKYPTNVVSGISPEAGSYYQTLLRSSEMWLIAAESFSRLGVEDSARYYLDGIRMRANPTASPITAGGQALLDSIYLERRKELAFEGLRMFDLLRWKKGVNRTDVVNNAPKTLSYPNNFAISPIPDLDVKQLGIPQNPGY